MRCGWRTLTGDKHTLQELTAAVARAEAGKVEAQRELHEMQIKASAVCEASGMGTRMADHEAVSDIIEEMEAHGIGARCAACGGG